MKLKNKFSENYFFLGLICLIFLFGFYSLVKTPHQKSTTENRSLNQFQHFTLKDFVDSTFQDNFENALSDQFVFSEKIRTAYGQTISNFPTFGIYDLICHNRYVTLPESFNYSRTTFDCGDYIVFRSLPLNEEQQQTFLNESIAKYNRINNLADTYYYFLNDATIHNFENDNLTIDIANILQNHLTGKYHFATFDLENYEEYKKYFYKTDHHWNYLGSYKGYTDITHLLGIQNPAKPTGTFTHHEQTFGSHARNTRNYNFPEEFTVYTFDIPKHNTIVNRKSGQYGHYQEYINHDYKYNSKNNYYAYFYGGDVGQIIFDFHNPKKDNLLIIANSFSNPINTLIAQHFNKTYVIDLRHYEKNLGHKFSASKYIHDNDIDKVLFIISPSFFKSDEFNQGLEL